MALPPLTGDNRDLIFRTLFRALAPTRAKGDAAWGAFLDNQDPARLARMRQLLWSLPDAAIAAIATDTPVVDAKTGDATYTVAGKAHVLPAQYYAVVVNLKNRAATA